VKKVNNIFIAFFFISITAGVLVIAHPVSASPYGVGIYNAVVPYGGQTSLTINVSSVVISAVPANSGQLSTSNNVVTVNSTDVTGYKLYLNALTTANLTGTLGTITASSNVAAAALATNTWGYNTDASTNFIGMTTTPALIKNFVGPAAPSVGGDVTTVTYGVKLDFSKSAGSYSTNILYTAAPQTT
jgi:hypothetical protein